MYQRILVPVDGSPTSNRALEEAGRLASEQNAQLRIIHVIDYRPLYLAEGIYPDLRADGHLREQGESILTQAATSLQQKNVASETALLEATDKSIPEVLEDDAKSWGADLLVLGTHGRHGLDRLFLGSVAERVARLATIPVLLVRGR